MPNLRYTNPNVRWLRLIKCLPLLTQRPTTTLNGRLTETFLPPGVTKLDLKDHFITASLADKPQDLKTINEGVEKFFYEESTDHYYATMKIFSDTFFFFSTNTAVKFHSRREAKVYYYYFDYRGSNSFSNIFGETDDVGAVHLDDILYLFPQDYMFPNWKKTASDERMVDFMVALWTNFARKGDPTPTWEPVSSPDTLEFAHLDAEGLHVERGLLKERVAFWESLPMKYKYPHSVNRDEL